MSNEELMDEGLVEAYRLGDSSALDILLKRYELPLRNFALAFSWWKDIDDIIGETFLTIFKEIRSGNFEPREPGSFKKWAYKVAKHHCLKASEKRRGEPKPLSEMYPEELPDDLVKVRPEPETDPAVFDHLRGKLTKARDSLKPEERRLIDLRREGLSYKQIKELPDFQKFSLGRLRLKYHEIIGKLRTILRKEKKI